MLLLNSSVVKLSEINFWEKTQYKARIDFPFRSQFVCLLWALTIIGFNFKLEQIFEISRKIEET